MFTPYRVKNLNNCTHTECLITFFGPVQGCVAPGPYYMNPALGDYTLLPDSVVEVDFFSAHVTFKASFDKSALRNANAVSGYCSISGVLVQD